MATTVILPKQGQSVETCLITEWYKKKGDKVAIGDLLFSYETDKASFEEESQAEGILLDVFYMDGDEVPVLAEVAVIGEPGEVVERPLAFGAETSMEEAPPSTETTTAPEQVPATDPAIITGEAIGVSVQESSGTGSNGKVRISPRARNLAGDKGISIDNITGSGPNGRIIVRDVEAIITGVPIDTAPPVADAPPAEPAPSPAPSPAEPAKPASTISYTEDSDVRPL
ncbi:MAG: E3 binding domain-containing protein, partial [Bacteroidales bacterium]|nr:E3 binding domain-containing protein [Bacteroidales bacterium]